MRSSRIKKYSKEIVCHDMVLSCIVDHLEDVPLIKKGEIRAFSYKDIDTRSVSYTSDRGPLSIERNVDLCGFLVCWHLLNQRAAPLSLEGQEYSAHKASSQSTKRSRFSLSLKGKQVEIAIERWLLFILPRVYGKENNTLSPLHTSQKRSFGVYKKDIKNTEKSSVAGATSFSARPLPPRCLRRDLQSVRALYFSTALSIQTPPSKVFVHTEKKVCTSLDEGSKNKVNGHKFIKAEESVFLFKKDVVSTCAPITRDTSKDKRSPIKIRSEHKDMARLESKANLYVAPRPRLVHTDSVSILPLSRKKRTNSLYLHCSNVLLTPEMQDLAQSGFVLLEGSISLQLLCR